MWLRKEQGNCSIGPYTWANDGDVIWVDDPVMADELVQAKNDITEAQEPEAGESTEDGPAPFSFEPATNTPDFVDITASTDGVAQSSGEQYEGEFTEYHSDDFDWQVPNGTAAEILSWVNGDPQRIQAALDAERARGADARSTLVAKLEKLAE